jgi:hypothetical protein
LSKADDREPRSPPGRAADDSGCDKEAQDENLIEINVIGDEMGAKIPGTKP